MANQAEETPSKEGIAESDLFTGGKLVCPVYGTAHRYSVPIKWREKPNNSQKWTSHGFPVTTVVLELSCPCLTASKEIA